MGLGAALWFALPVIVAGAVHVAIIRRGVLPGLAAVPLDGGLSWRGRRIFGANKSLRGLVVMTLAGGATAALLALLRGDQPGRGFALGFALGAGYVLGELPNSFVKRQLGVAPGAAAPGSWGAVFWFVDQVDSLVGVLLAARLFGPVSWQLLGWLLLITLVLHPLFAWVMVLLGLKRRVG